MKLTFFGGAGTVTGSKYLLETGGARILIDCGLFQGLKRLRERNWQAPPFDPKALGAVVLTHAHLDHSGYLPVIARAGFRDLVINAAHLAEQLIGALGDGSRYGVRIRWSREPEPLEPAGGIATAMPLCPEGPLVVVAGDVCTQFDYASLRTRAVADAIIRR